MNMKKTRKLFPILLLTGLLTLSGCSLFNDDDIAISNSYNPKTSQSEEEGGVYVEGVRATNREETGEDVMYFRSICYAVDGKVENTYKEGGVNHTEYNVNGGQDYEGNVTNFNYDLYVPESASRTGKHTVILFIHGGAWVSGFKMQVNPYVQEFARRGYITATIKYTLLKKEMNDASLSIFRDLDEIDACIKSIKKALEDEDLGFDTTKTELVIGGASSGSHLAMLYSYSRGDAAALPIKFIVDAVGPVNIKPDCWKTFKRTSDEEAYQALVDGGIEYDKIQEEQTNGNIYPLGVAGFDFSWNEYQTMRIANGMCGIPYSLEDVEASTDENKIDIVNPNAASDSMTKAGGGEDQLSVTYWMSPSNKIPMVCAYAGKDPIVGINQFATLQHEMESNGMVKGTDYEFFYFPNSSHEQITDEANHEVYQAFIQKVDDWCRA